MIPHDWDDPGKCECANCENDVAVEDPHARMRTLIAGALFAAVVGVSILYTIAHLILLSRMYTEVNSCR